jgi:hypothetical protein
MGAAEHPDPWRLIDELDSLIAQERALSDVRRRLHTQIDFGFANEMSKLRERQISDERLALHREIDALRAQLGLVVWDAASSLEDRRRLRDLGL